MPISIKCPNCAKTLKVADEAAGKKVRCPACKSVMAVPMPQEELVEPEEELVEPEPESFAVTEKPAPPAKKAAWDDDPPAKSTSKDDENYGLDADDEDEREERRRDRKRKEKRRRRDEAEGRRRSYQPHRGVVILVLGSVALCGACLCAIIGWGLGSVVLGMANTDLAKMDNRVMDDSGRGMTTAGKVCALIAFGLGLINAILGIAMNINRMR
jgi:phage FluMu protein Com